MDDRTKGYKYCYGKTRIDDKKIRAHRFIWKTLDRKDHGQRRRKFTMSKISTKWEKGREEERKASNYRIDIKHHNRKKSYNFSSPYMLHREQIQWRKIN